jgi:hypothetical protein
MSRCQTVERIVLSMLGMLLTAPAGQADEDSWSLRPLVAAASLLNTSESLYLR